MRVLFKDIFEYHNHFNQQLLKELEKHHSKLPERTYPLFCHVLNAHQIWNARILKQETLAIMAIHAFQKCREIDEANYANTYLILDNYDLDDEVTYTNTKGQEFTNTIRDILFHAANHSTHHKGQIVSDFRQVGIEPIVTDYIFYKR